MKPHEPEIQFFLPSPNGHVPLDDSTSHVPLRLTRQGVMLPGDLTLNYGQYFKGIADVIANNGYASLVQATARQLGRNIFLSDIDRILIYAEKHGSDYHPARIEVVLAGAIATFAMNVAVTERGKDRLGPEYEVLQGLNKKYDFHYLPRAYFHGKALRPALPMFLADWFEGYHEFHLSVDRKNGSQRVILWDTDRGNVYLSDAQVREIYRQASMILTLYYDVETFEQIFPWHHAAGDFVVRVDGKSVDVKLITARQYASMFGCCDGVSAHEALLFLLLNLSLRMRLDRLDGVGPVAWADEGCVDATIEGFTEGVRIKMQQEYISERFLKEFIIHIRTLAEKDLLDRVEALVGACDQSASDILVIKNHLREHTLKLATILKSLTGL
jgi:hypothetical protein